MRNSSLGAVSKNAVRFAAWIALFAVAALVTNSSRARAAYYSTVLYQLTLPNGYSSTTLNDAYVAVGGQAIGNATIGSGLNISNRAMLWAPNGSVSDLTPNNVNSSAGVSTNGSQQVGVAGHAALWSGTAASAVDLNPSGYNGSGALGVGGGQQVGYGTKLPFPGSIHFPLLWSGTAASAVDLTPAGFVSADAVATDGTHQVGNGRPGSFYNALLWSGTAASAVNLNPSGFTESYASGVSGSQQVGYGRGTPTGQDIHALLWTGTAASVVDLNPAGYITSSAGATNGTQQAGVGGNHAMLWSGTAASAVDLHLVMSDLPSWTGSRADAIDANGNVFGIAYGPGGVFAMEWSPAPEPGTAVLAALGAIGLVSVARKRRKRADIKR